MLEPGRLPAGLGYAGQLAVERHLPELHPAEAEAAHVPFRATADLAPVMEALGGGVARQLVELVPLAFCLKLLADLGVLLHEVGPLVFPGDERCPGHKAISYSWVDS